MKSLFHLLITTAVLMAGTVYSADPQLAAHWKLDDKDGDVVLDASPAKANGTIVAKPGRVAGKIGGALMFNGKDNYVEIPNSADLDKINQGSYSIAAWFKPEIVPEGKDDTANDAEFGIVIKTGWHEGLSYNRHKKFTMHHWLHGDAEPTWTGIGTWEDEYEPGQWYHVVGVVDDKARVVKIFLNGELKRTSDPWGEAAKARDFEGQTWKLGVAAPGADQYAWFAKGAIDDVRIYKDALTDDHVNALYKAGAKDTEK